MSDLIILVYRNQTEAYVSGETLVVLQQEAGTEPEDIVVVTKAADGRVSVNSPSILLRVSRWVAGVGEPCLG